MTDENAANLYYKRGVALFDVRRYKLAELEFRKGLLADPRHFECLYALCTSLTNNDNLKEASHLAEKFISLFPDYYHGYYLQGRIHFLQNAVSLCVKSLNIALSIDPDEEHSLLLLSKTYVKQQKLSIAMNTISIAVRNNPEFYEGILLKLQIVVLRSKIDKDLALQLINALLTLKPDQATTHHAIADYYNKINMAEDAIRHFRLALKMNPDNPQIKWSYHNLISQINLSLKGPNMLFGVRMYPVDFLTLGLFYFFTFSILWEGLSISGYGNAKMTGTVWIVCFILLMIFFFLLPFYFMFIYLKHIKKRHVSINPFSKKDLIFEEYNNPLSFATFFKLNNYHNFKVILLSFVISFIVLESALFLPEKYTRIIVSSISIFGSLIILSQLKFRQE